MHATTTVEFIVMWLPYWFVTTSPMSNKAVPCAPPSVPPLVVTVVEHALPLTYVQLVGSDV